MRCLTKKQILAMHEEMVRATGGTPGLRDAGLLDSALAAQFQSYAGVSPYPSLQQKAARLGYGVVRNHPFVDGNKRIGAHIMLVFLALNGVELDYTQEELANIILEVAAGTASYEELLWWLLAHET